MANGGCRADALAPAPSWSLAAVARRCMAGDEGVREMPPVKLGGSFRDRLPADAPKRWVEPGCRYCKPADPCVLHDCRPKTLAQNRVLFGECFGYEPTAEDHLEADFPW